MDIRRLVHSRALQLSLVAVASLAAGFAAGTLRKGPAPAVAQGGDTKVAEAAQPVVGTPEEGLQTAAHIEAVFRQVARSVLPAVVEVDVTDVLTASVPRVMSPFEFFFGPQSALPIPQGQLKRQGLGSGVIVRRAGEKLYVLTNNHVVADGEQIQVKLADGRQYSARLVGKDEKIDLALIEFSGPEDIPVAALGDSDGLQVGDWVLAVGSPLGFDSTVTEGIVSAVGRRPRPGGEVALFTDYIQTDAAINRGNSGGALVNMHGQVVGINSWIASPSGGSVGLGFAIPINQAKRAIDDFITKGRVDYGWLGINLGSVPPQDAAGMHIQGIPGAFVYGVFAGSPAAAAGILPGDYITAVNGEPVRDPTQLLLLVANLRAGDSAGIALRRGGQRVSVKVQVGQRADDQALEDRQQKLWPGVAVVGLSDDIRRQLGLARSAGDVIVGRVDPGSAAGAAGLEPGDIVREIDGRQVVSVADFYRLLNAAAETRLSLTLVRQGGELEVALVRPGQD